MDLPFEFIQTVRGVFGKQGVLWIERLPALIAQVSEQWGLSNIQTVPNLSYNYAAFARRGEDEVVLKIGVPDRELKSGMAALEIFNGHGTCHLLEHDEEKGVLLLERLKPGERLSGLGDDDQATNIAVDVMQKIWRLPPAAGKFIQLRDWFDGLGRIRPHFKGGTGPIPKQTLERIEAILPELFADSDVKLLHGDLHHDNILSSERGWMGIDPKGVIGPSTYETGPLMLNPRMNIPDGSRLKARLQRRAAILAERLGQDRRKIIQWATAHAVLSTWWGIEDHTDWQYCMWYTEVLGNIN